MLAVVAACASQPTVVVWEKPGAGPREVEAARAACLAEIEVPSGPGPKRTRFEADTTGACFVRCMRERGFTWRTEKAGAAPAADAQVPASGPPGGSSGPSPAGSAPEPEGCPVPPPDEVGS